MHTTDWSRRLWRRDWQAKTLLYTENVELIVSALFVLEWFKKGGWLDTSFANDVPWKRYQVNEKRTRKFWKRVSNFADGVWSCFVWDCHFPVFNSGYPGFLIWNWKYFLNLLFLVLRAVGIHPIPSRTRKLSLPAPMVPLWGRVGQCQEQWVQIYESPFGDFYFAKESVNGII